MLVAKMKFIDSLLTELEDTYRLMALYVDFCNNNCGR